MFIDQTVSDRFWWNELVHGPLREWVDRCVTRAERYRGGGRRRFETRDTHWASHTQFPANTDEQRWLTPVAAAHRDGATEIFTRTRAGVALSA